jgi:hypothetical protein
MAAPPSGICDVWTTPEELEGCPADCDLTQYTDEQVDQAIVYASNLLYRLSGRQWPGVCEDTVNPCLFVSCWPDGRVWLDGWTPPYVPYRTREGWRNAFCGGCCHLHCLTLPGPIVEIVEVVVDSVVLDPSAYRVRGWGSVCRTDGERWPVGTDPSDDSFYFIWNRGVAVPDDGRLMASILACARLPDIACNDDCTGDTGGLESISADGVVRNFADLTNSSGPMAGAQGLTGIRIVDEWIRSVNPHGRARPAALVDALSPMRHAAKWT